VAAIFAGGVIRYRAYRLTELTAASSSDSLSAALVRSPPVDLWRLPGPKLCLAYAFSGQSVSTPDSIEAIEHRLDAAHRESFVLASDEQTRAVEEGLTGGDFQSVRAAVRELERLLSSLGPLEDEAACRIIAIAESYGCAAKISGAGAGDGCVVFAPDPEARRAALAGLAARGFFAFPLEIEGGLRGESNRCELLARWLEV
jgi:phosphomevalonate kinase